MHTQTHHINTDTCFLLCQCLKIYIMFSSIWLLEILPNRYAITYLIFALLMNTWLCGFCLILLLQMIVHGSGLKPDCLALNPDHYLLATQPWPSLSRSLSFLICIMGKIKNTFPHWAVVGMDEEYQPTYSQTTFIHLLTCWRMFTNHLSRGKKPWCVLCADFYGINFPTRTSFKLPV